MRKRIVWLLLGGLALGCAEGFDLLNPIGPTLPPVAPIEDYFGRWRNVDQEDGNYLTASISPIGGDAQVELLTGGATARVTAPSAFAPRIRMTCCSGSTSTCPRW